MQIQSGKLYENRTWKYLYPCLRYYGEDLMTRLSSFFKLAVGVGDYNKKEKVTSLYILVDTNIPLASDNDRQIYKDKFSKFLDWISYKHYYVSDYSFGKNMHMVVIKLPRDYEVSYISFINGKYSEMYEQKDINKFFKYISLSNKQIEEKQNSKIKLTRQILTKSKEYLPKFVEKVNKDFNSTVTVRDFENAELDYPPIKEEEIFNYQEVGEVT